MLVARAGGLCEGAVVYEGGAGCWRCEAARAGYDGWAHCFGVQIWPNTYLRVRMLSRKVLAWPRAGRVVGGQLGGQRSAERRCHYNTTTNFEGPSNDKINHSFSIPPPSLVGMSLQYHQVPRRPEFATGSSATTGMDEKPPDWTWYGQWWISINNPVSPGRCAAIKSCLAPK
jgi:hypothetical protein